MEGNNQLTLPEDDEDLEALRIAALQSLKRKSGDSQVNQTNESYFNGSPRNKQKRGKFPRSLQGRPRNGQFNSWSRSSNLIAVPMLQDPDEPPNPKKPTPDEPPKLILPQDRYCKLEKSPDKPDNPTSKFDRYNNSEESESESEEDPSPLKRSNSLEELMAELEQEIQGGTASVEKPKPKKKRVKVTTPPPVASQPITAKENLEPANRKPFRAARKWRPPPFVQSPPSVFGFAPPVQAQSYPPIGGLFVAPPPQPVFEAPPPVVPVYEPRPLSPIRVSTEGFVGGALMAPLSPRSAAFVLENRAIVEKRKRRSYSRSPTPVRFRRSISPKRSSLSPRRISRTPPRRRSLSPSPIRKSNPPPLPRNKPKEEEKDKKKTIEDKTKKEDPILEARRRRFERPEPIKEGVVRLKKEREVKKEKELLPAVKKEKQLPEIKQEKTVEMLEEEALLAEDDDDISLAEDAILLEPKIDELFSDEESDSDNEGRFKTKQNETKCGIAALPFTKLVNGTKESAARDVVSSDGRRRMKRRRRGRSRGRRGGVTMATPVVEKKIEIKIRNPGKYKEEVKVEEKKEEGDANVSEGDLRAQLSRKRAERQKHPLPDVVPSRLLQSALQDVGFKKPTKSEKIKEEITTEGKLPIRLRLGSAGTSETFGKKRKNKGSQEQV